MGQDRIALYSTVELASCGTTGWGNCAGEIMHHSPWGAHWPGCFFVLLRWHFLLPELLHIWRWRKVKNLKPALNTDTEIWRYGTRVLALNLFFSSFIKRENIENTPMVNRNKSERGLRGCFSATAKNTLVIVSDCRKADISRYLFSLLLVI